MRRRIPPKTNTVDEPLLLQIDQEGNCKILKKWDFSLLHSTNIAMDDKYIYFGQNNMITKLNLKTGERVYLTNKDDETLKEMIPLF